MASESAILAIQLTWRSEKHVRLALIMQTTVSSEHLWKNLLGLGEIFFQGVILPITMPEMTAVTCLFLVYLSGGLIRVAWRTSSTFQSA